MDKTDKLIDWEENEDKDLNRNGLADDIEPPIPDIAAGSKKMAERMRDDGLVDPTITGGETDVQWEGAQFSGDESAVSSMSVPGQSNVGDIGDAMGIHYEEGEELKVGEKERSRDVRRWELDPASSEDYVARVRDEES
ncbi:MAG: DUF6335 family protein [Thermoanaerobaculia bacterium]